MRRSDDEVARRACCARLRFEALRLRFRSDIDLLLLMLIDESSLRRESPPRLLASFSRRLQAARGSLRVRTSQRADACRSLMAMSPR